MKKSALFLSLIAALFLSSCSADYDDYAQISKGEINKIYFMEDSRAFIDLKVASDSIVEIPVCSHKDYSDAYKELRKGDNIFLYRFSDKGQPGENFLSSKEIKAKDFEKIKSSSANENTIILALSILVAISVLFLLSILLCTLRQ